MTARMPCEEFDQTVDAYLNDPWTSKVLRAAAGIEGLCCGRLTRESACNPIAQARILVERKIDLNVIVGLCVSMTRCS